MYIVKYSELVHMAEMHSQARASSPYELGPNILRYTFTLGKAFLLWCRAGIRPFRYGFVEIDL